MTFIFLCSTLPVPFVLIPFFPRVADFSPDFIYQVKVSQKVLKKVNFLNQKWQVVGKHVMRMHLQGHLSHVLMHHKNSNFCRKKDNKNPHVPKNYLLHLIHICVKQISIFLLLL